MPKREIDVREFAERVERLCNFILDKIPKDGSDDVKLIQNLKDDAADLQASSKHLNVEGLHAYIHGG